MPTIPAVAYVRMSSDKQEASPKQQREAIEQMADGKYRIVRWYQDEGISGSADDAIKAIARYVACSRLESHERVLRSVSGDTAAFHGREFLGPEILSVWHALPTEARLIAYLLAAERVDEDTRRGESDL
jgi:hypothetical protein